jgi:N-acetyl-gamma-glutamylphosphate reductase
LIELMDNNPIVCADIVSVPTPGTTLALIALGPLAASGMMVDSPTLSANVPVNEPELSTLLSDAGWDGGFLAQEEDRDLGGAVALTAIAAIRTPSDFEEIDEIFAERYERSFFVRADESSDWHVNLVLGSPFAKYRLRISPDQPTSLLTIQTMADRNGKCGAAQVVHAMNVMCGFEESLGLA